MKTARLSTLIAGVAVSATLLAGCSTGEVSPDPATSSGDAAAGLEAAAAVLAEAQQSVEDANVPESAPELASDKLIVTIPCAYAAEGCKRSVDGFAAVAEAAGWETMMIDPAGDPEKTRAAIQTAIRLNADGIVLAAVPQAVVKTAVEEAQAAGIVVANTFELGNDLYDINAVSDDEAAGRALAAFVTVDSEGEGKVIIANAPEFEVVVARHKGFVEGLAEFCPGCTIVEDFDFQLAGLQSQFPAQFQALLQANPDADYVWTPFDPAAAAIAPIIERSPSAGNVNVMGFNGDGYAIDAIEAGDQPQVATIATPIEWQSAAAFDLMNRWFAGERDGLDIMIPTKLITQDNITTKPWDGDVDWRSAYEAIWAD